MPLSKRRKLELEVPATSGQAPASSTATTDNRAVDTHEAVATATAAYTAPRPATPPRTPKHEAPLLSSGSGQQGQLGQQQGQQLEQQRGSSSPLLDAPITGLILTPAM